MDTDDLSREAYKAIIIEAGRLHEDLRLQFGLIAASCKSEKEYLLNAKKLIKEIKALDKTDLSAIFFSSPPDKKYLLLTLKKIFANILEVEKIAEDKRHYEF